jgi:DNA-binding XRE family transcriptional regulator
MDSMTGKQFRDARESCGMTQTRLARFLGVTQTTISRLERSESVRPLWQCAIIGVRTQLNEQANI